MKDLLAIGFEGRTRVGREFGGAVNYPLSLRWRPGSSHYSVEDRHLHGSLLLSRSHLSEKGPVVPLEQVHTKTSFGISR